jgi:predicted HTH domain antitoxin
MKRSPEEMLKLLKEKGVQLYPNLSTEKRRKVMFIINEPEITAKKNTK